MKSGKWIGQMLYPKELNWPISHLNDSETQERGLEGVKIQKISWWSMPPDSPRRFNACLGNRSVFILDPRLKCLYKTY